MSSYRVVPHHIAFAITIEVSHPGNLPAEVTHLGHNRDLQYLRAIHQPYNNQTCRRVMPHQVRFPVSIQISRRM
jgi:hypothetical protein